MRTRLSKHGKYRIYEGAEREVGDMLRPGDQLTTIITADGEKATFEVRVRIRDYAQFNANKHLLGSLALSNILFHMASDMDGDFFANRNAYLILDNEGRYMIWWPIENHHYPVKIKRRIRITEDDTKDTHTHVGTITGEHVHADSVKELAHNGLPDRPGWWVDREGDLWIVAYRDGNLVMSFIGTRGELVELPVLESWPDVDPDDPSIYVPFHPVNVSYEIKEDV